jgi:metallo-beta-lactamase class B
LVSNRYSLNKRADQSARIGASISVHGRSAATNRYFLKIFRVENLAGEFESGARIAVAKRMIVVVVSLAVVILAMAADIQATDDPLLQPVRADHARRWLKPQKPVQIFGNSYLVGFRGLNVGLVRTNAGLMLIDGAVPQAVPAIEANIRALGFSLRDIKFILSTEPHYDHAGGLAALARDTGATVIVSAKAAKELMTGVNDPGDPQAGSLPSYPGVQRLRIVKDGDAIRLGGTTVTAFATPGHTAGSMSWSWQSCEGKRCLGVVFGSSLNPVSAKGYRFSDPGHQPVVDNFRRSFGRFRSMPCDILLTAHPQQSGGDKKIDRLIRNRDVNPFVDPAACKAYAHRHEALLDARLAEERGSLQP